eukprot:Hpha_TRINITY_DN16503_c3_g1::TRINITY_DN16503_c3_g1_i10::g.132371::m.132371
MVTKFTVCIRTRFQQRLHSVPLFFCYGVNQLAVEIRTLLRRQPQHHIHGALGADTCVRQCLSRPQQLTPHRSHPRKSLLPHQTPRLEVSDDAIMGSSTSTAPSGQLGVPTAGSTRAKIKSRAISTHCVTPPSHTTKKYRN